MNDLYDQKFLELILSCMQDEVNDLGKWSVSNNDKGLDEIYDLKKAFEKVQEALKGDK